MVKSNYEILGISESATKHEIRDAFRKLVLEHHSDRGGNDDEFKRIKQAFDDLKEGKKYPDSEKTSKKKSKFYSGTSEEERRKKNLLLSNDIAREVKTAQEWAAALNRIDSIGTKLFGSKELGQMEFERKAAKSLSIKGKFWAGNFEYDGPIIMWGSITNPFFSNKEELKTNIRVTKGKFSLIDPIENGFIIENGAKITVDDGDIIVGDVFGKRELVQDPKGRVGMYLTKEHYTQLTAPKGKIIAGNVMNTVQLEADSILVLNLDEHVKIKGRNISVLGSKVTYNVEFELLKGGTIKFHDQGSGFDISDDAKVKLENGKIIRLDELKVSKLIGYGGVEITYDYLENLDKNSNQQNSGKWSSKLGKFGNIFHN